MEDSINTYYFWMNTEKRAVQRRQGAPGHQLRDRPRGAQPDLRRPAAPDAADPAAGHARLRGVQALPGPGHEQGQSSCSPRPIRPTRTSRSGPTTSPTASGSASTTTTCSPSSGFNATLKVIAGDVYLHDDRQPVDAGSGHRVRRLVPGLPAPGRLLPPAAATATASCRPTATTSRGSTSPANDAKRTSC